MFISEPITPEPGSFDTPNMAAGLASPPGAVQWRGRRYVVSEVLEHFKESAPEQHKPGAERYLRRQVFRVRLDSGETAEIYVQRQAKTRQRWFLYSITPAGGI